MPHAGRRQYCELWSWDGRVVAGEDTKELKEVSTTYRDVIQVCGALDLPS